MKLDITALTPDFNYLIYNCFALKYIDLDPISSFHNECYGF